MTVIPNYGPQFGPFDVIGCGVQFHEDCYKIFYTLNGRYLGVAFVIYNSAVLFPIVGIDATISVTFNFGSEQFLFDFDNL